MFSVSFFRSAGTVFCRNSLGLEFAAVYSLRARLAPFFSHGWPI